MHREIRSSFDDRALDLGGEQALTADSSEGALVAVTFRRDLEDLHLEPGVGSPERVGDETGLG